MPKALLAWVGILLAGAGSCFAAQLESLSPVPSHASDQRALLDRYCIVCHNEQARTAGLVLSTMDVENVSKDAQGWEKVVRKLRAGQMPPAGMPRPDQPTYDSLATYLETELDRAAAAKPNPGRPAVSRLNRTEYSNAIRDLLAVEIDGASLFPADDSRYGFDNIGDVLTVSPLLSERYLSAARKISRLAIGDPSILPAFERYDVPRYYMQDDRMNEALPFGSRGGMAIRHYFPLDGEYVIRIRLVKNHREYIRGLAEPHLLDVRLDGARIKLFSIGGEHKGPLGTHFFHVRTGGSRPRAIREIDG